MLRGLRGLSGALALSLTEGFPGHSLVCPLPDKSTPIAFPTDNARATRDPGMCRTQAASPLARFQSDLLAGIEAASWAFTEEDPGVGWGQGSLQV